MSDATFTFRVDEGLKAEFASAAKAHDRTGAQLLRDFKRNYVLVKSERTHFQAAAANSISLGVW